MKRMRKVKEQDYKSYQAKTKKPSLVEFESSKTKKPSLVGLESLFQ